MINASMQCRIKGVHYHCSVVHSTTNTTTTTDQTTIHNNVYSIVR
jgi:hypothetical protein